MDVSAPESEGFWIVQLDLEDGGPVILTVVEVSKGLEDEWVVLMPGCTQNLLRHARKWYMKLDLQKEMTRSIKVATKWLRDSNSP